VDRLIAQYAATLSRLIAAAEATRLGGAALPLGQAFTEVIAALRATAAAGNKLMFIGNGGSAGIASHSAIDYSKNGAMPALAFNDSAALTCLGNDYGYDSVFSRQIEMHARPGDLLIALSSSGRSLNILRAVDAARGRGCGVLTLSGFCRANPLRSTGDVNLYVASDQYGFVELTHQSLIHAILDMAMGWQGQVHADEDTPAASE